MNNNTVMSPYWRKTTTDKDRYDRLGVSGFIRDYAKNHGKEKLVVIDVGCSTGMAIIKCRSVLEKMHSIHMHVIGCDINEEARKSFEESKQSADPYGVDEFFYGPASDMPARYVGSADVVICANVIRYVDGHTCADVIRDCCRLLKHDGILVTDAGGYCMWGCRKPPSREELPSADTKHPGSVDSGKCIWLSRLLNRLESREIFTVKRNDGLVHADNIEKEWKRLSPAMRWAITKLKSRILI